MNHSQSGKCNGGFQSHMKAEASSSRYYFHENIQPIKHAVSLPENPKVNEVEGLVHQAGLNVFIEVEDLLHQAGLDIFIVQDINLRRVFFLKNAQGGCVYSCYSIALPEKLQHLLRDRVDLVIDYLAQTLFPEADLPILDSFIDSKLLTEDIVSLTLKHKTVDLLCLPKVQKNKLKHELKKRNLLSLVSEQTYFSSDTASSSFFPVNSALANRRSKLQDLLQLKRLEKDKKLMLSSLSLPNAELKPEEDAINLDDFNELDNTPKSKKKKPKKKPKKKAGDASQTSVVDEDVLEEIETAPIMIDIDLPPNSLLQSDSLKIDPPLQDQIIIQESLIFPPDAFSTHVERREKINRSLEEKPDKQEPLMTQLNRRTIKYWKKTAERLGLKKLLANLKKFKKTAELVESPLLTDIELPVLSTETALVEAQAAPTPDPIKYYLEERDFPWQLKVVLPMLAYLEAKGYTPLLYGSCVLKSVLNRLGIKNKIEPNDIDLIFQDTVNLTGVLEQCGGFFKPNPDNLDNLFYEQYRGVFRGVRVDITVPKRGYAIHDSIEFAYLRAQKVPMKSQFEFKLMTRDGRFIATAAELKTIINRIATGVFDIYLPNIPTSHVAFRSFFMRVTKYIGIWSDIFPEFKPEMMPNLQQFLNPEWQKSYFMELMRLYTPRGVPFAYLEVAELVLWNDAIAEKILPSFLSVLLADHFNQQLMDKYKQALMLKSPSLSFDKRCIIANITHLFAFMQGRFAKLPSYQHVVDDPLIQLFSVPLPSYAALSPMFAPQRQKLNPSAPVFNFMDDKDCELTKFSSLTMRGLSG